MRRNFSHCGAQLPMEFALVGALKKAVKIRFKLLTSGIKLATNEWTLPLLKIKLRDWKIENEIMSQPSVSEKAHFTPAGSTFQMVDPTSP